MIVFSGELDKNGKQYVKNKLLKFTAKISIMILLVLSIPIILLKNGFTIEIHNSAAAPHTTV